MKFEKLGKFIKHISKRNNNLLTEAVNSVTNDLGFVKSTDFFDKKVFSKNLKNYKIVTKNQFAYNPSRINVGSIDYLKDEENVIVSPLYVVFECNHQIYPEYLKRFLKSPLGETKIRSKTKGAVRQILSFSSLSEVEIPLIPFEEQVRVATLLSRISDLIEWRKENNDRLVEYLLSSFINLFGDPIKNEHSWQILKISDVVNEINAGNSYRGVEKPNLSFEELGVLKISAVTKGVFRDKEFKAVRKESIKKKVIFCEKGMFLFSRANTRELIAACCIVPKNYPSLFLPDKLWSLDINENIVNKIYLNYLFKVESFRNEFRRKASGGHASMLNISMKKFRSIDLPVPPLEVQNKFVNIVKRVEALQVLYLKSLGEIGKLYGALCQKAFKGVLNLSGLEIVHDNIIPKSGNINLKELAGSDVEILIPHTEEVSFDKDSISEELSTKSSNKSKLTWEDVSSQQVAKWITKKYKGCYFSIEMLIRFLEEEQGTLPYYFSSEELKTNPKLNEADDLKSFLFSAIGRNSTNPFIKIEQVFYNGRNNNLQLNFTEEDNDFVKGRTKEELSGIYFKIKE